jgi:hypothetical protein
MGKKAVALRPLPSSASSWFRGLPLSQLRTTRRLDARYSKSAENSRDLPADAPSEQGLFLGRLS